VNNIEKLKRLIIKMVKGTRMHKGDKAQMKLSEFFHSSPLAVIDLSRDKSLPRNTKESHRP
jgi:hypothetical protein